MEALGSAISRFIDKHLIITLLSVVAAAIEFLKVPNNTLKQFNVYFYLLVLFAASFLVFSAIKGIINICQDYRNHRYLARKHSKTMREEEDKAAREIITENNTLTSEQKQFIFNQVLNDNKVDKMVARDFYALRNQRLGGSLKNVFVEIIKEQVTADGVKIKLDDMWYQNILILLAKFERISDFDEEEENLEEVVNHAKNKVFK